MDYKKMYRERYKKFAKNNLPQPYWDKERDTREYVFFNDGEPNVSSNLAYSFEYITWAGFYYPFTCKFITSRLEDGKYVRKVVVGHSHAHDFDSVIRALYESPNSFKISKSEEEFYSKQELKYLKEVQEYLLFLGVEDIEKYPVSVSRYRNKKQAKYANASKNNYKTEVIKELVDGKRDYVVLKWYKSYGKDKRVYKPEEYRALVKDEKGKYRLYVEYTFSEIKKYKDIKNECKIDEFKDNDKIILLHLKILEVF